MRSGPPEPSGISKEPVRTYGVTGGVLKEWTKEFVRARRGEWGVEQAVTFCQAMLDDPHLEARGTGYQVVAAFGKHAGPEPLRDVERWLEEYCGNWALVDNLATSVLSPLLRKYPELIPEVERWTSSPNPWHVTFWSRAPGCPGPCCATPSRGFLGRSASGCWRLPVEPRFPSPYFTPLGRGACSSGG